MPVAKSPQVSRTPPPPKKKYMNISAIRFVSPISSHETELTPTHPTNGTTNSSRVISGFSLCFQRSSGNFSSDHSSKSTRGSLRSGGSGGKKNTRGRSPPAASAAAERDASTTPPPGGEKADHEEEEEEDKPPALSSNKDSSSEAAAAGGGKAEGGEVGGGLLDGVDDVQEVEDDESDSDDDAEPDYWSKYGVIDAAALDEDVEIEI